MNDKKKLAKNIIIVYVIVGILIPIVLKYSVFENTAYSLLSNDGWASFLGSYVGGVLGGLGTLIAVYLTIRQTIDYQEQSKRDTDEMISAQNLERQREYNRDKQDRDIERHEDNRKRELERRVRFSEEIADQIGKYITHISKYFFANVEIERLYEEKKMLQEAINSKENELRRINHQSRCAVSEANPTWDQQLVSLDIRESQAKMEYDKLLRKCEEKKREIDSYRSFGNRVEANEAFFTIKTKLSDIKEGEDLVACLEEFHLGMELGKRVKQSNKNQDWIDLHSKALIDEFARFRKRYVEEYK